MDSDQRMKETFYNFHGVGIAISGDEPVAAAVHSRFKQFPLADRSEIDFTFDFCADLAAGNYVFDKPSGSARPVYHPSVGEVVYYRGTDQLYIDHEGIRALCNLREKHVRVTARECGRNNLWLLSHPMVTLPLIELLKRHGRYNIHAAGLCVNGKGLLVAGSSGSGKSTLTVALLRGGFGFLADDMGFLNAGPDGLRVFAFPDEIDLTDETAALFPELHHLLSSPKSPGWPKRQIRAEEVYPVETVWECKPAVLILPRIANTDKSVLKRADPGEALLELTPNILLTEPGSSQEHLDILTRLVNESDCYRLETGRDFESIPQLLRELVE